MVHLFNGHSSLYLFEQTSIEGTTIVWPEILCEGPCTYKLEEEVVTKQRIDFIAAFFEIDKKEVHKKLIEQFELIQQIVAKDEVILWFEYDLFCQLNMIGLLSLLHRTLTANKISLVCVGTSADWSGLKGLGELDSTRFEQLMKERILLSKQDIEFADQTWKFYCGDQLDSLLQHVVQAPASFPYLAKAIDAHVMRFPGIDNGLNEIEARILKLVSTKTFTKKSLVKNMLDWQGYYGFGDAQYFQYINTMAPLIKFETILELTDLGVAVLNNQRNWLSIRKNETTFGGMNTRDNIQNRNY